ncbi:MAG TPA: hypothetical protein VNK96_07245 [Fimbriimonadales bacterium]|nr:hypothetical protein [Fimbriimonadales bacterium]
MENPHVFDLENRIRRLEKVIFILSLMLMTLVTLTVYMGCTQATAKSLKASKIEIVNEKGETRGLFFADKAGGALSLDDSNAKPRIVLGAHPDNPRIELFDSQGKRLVVLQAEAEGATLNVHDVNGELRATLGLYRNEPWLAFLDGSGKVIYTIPSK